VGDLRVSAAIAYLGSIRDCPNLTIRPGCVVERVLITQGRVDGLEVRGPAGPERIVAERVVLAAGAIGSPELLVASGVGDSDLLRGLGVETVQHLPGVGRNLRDHPTSHLDMAGPASLDLDPEVVGFQFGAVYTAAGSPYRNDMQIAPFNRHQRLPDLRPSGRFAFSLLCCVELPLSRGELVFASPGSGNRTRVEFHYLEDELDRRRFMDGLRITREIADAAPFRELGLYTISPTKADFASDQALERWLVEHIGSAFHGSGTCKLGRPDDPEAVVDARCRVYGVEGLYVADLSIVPANRSSNPNATALMIGERAADLIATAGPR
jgi:choline dehydrogenase